MLFHADVYFPEYVRGILPKGKQKLKYTKHAMREAQTDKYGTITLPRFVDFDSSQIIQVELNDKFKKFVVRYPLNDKRDVCLVVKQERSVWILITVWSNLKSDRHKSLDKSKYYSDK